MLDGLDGFQFGPSALFLDLILQFSGNYNAVAISFVRELEFMQKGSWKTGLSIVGE